MVLTNVKLTEVVATIMTLKTKLLPTLCRPLWKEKKHQAKRTCCFLYIKFVSKDDPIKRVQTFKFYENAVIKK